MSILRRLIRGFLQLSIGTLISRLFGMVREMVLANFFGASKWMDSFWVAFTIPNLLRQVIAEKSMESAFMPVYREYKEKKSNEETKRLIYSVATAILIISIIGAIPTFIYAKDISGLLAPGFNLEQREYTAILIRYMYFFMTFIGLAALTGAILQANEIYAPYSFAPISFSLAVIVSVIIGQSKLGLKSACIGVLIGGFAQFAVQVPFLRKKKVGLGKIRYKFSISYKDKGVRKVGKLAVPIFFETLLNRSVTVADRIIASLIKEGAISALNYAFRLIQLPFAIFGLAISRAFMPIMLEQFVTDKKEKFYVSIRFGISSTLLVMIPAMIWMISLRYPITRIVYQRGAFTPKHTQMVAFALAFYSLGLIGMTIYSILSRAFYSMQDTKTPVIISFVIAFTNIILNIILSKTSLTYAGLAAASSIAQTLGAILLFFLLLNKIPNLKTQIINKNFILDLIKYILVGILLYLSATKILLLSNTFLNQSLIHSIIKCILVASGSIIIYIILGLLLKISDFRLLSKRFAGYYKKNLS